MGMPLRCRLLGHDPGFRADGAALVWACARCGEGGSKDYATGSEAMRMAAALDRRPAADLGRRAPLIGLLPLRLWRRWRDRTRDAQPPS